MIVGFVAPHAGAWIEMISSSRFTLKKSTVAPHAGAWIEIYIGTHLAISINVAPHAGAWIEISKDPIEVWKKRGRTPRGCVD